MRTVPDVAANAPSNNLSSVVLPAPFKPITATRLLSGVISSVVASKPILPSSYMWAAWSRWNVTDEAGVERLPANSESKKPIPPIVTNRRRNRAQVHGQFIRIVRARMRGGRLVIGEQAAEIQQSRHTAGFGIDLTTWSCTALSSRPSSVVSSTMSPLASNVRPEDGCVAAKAVSWLATPGT